MDWLLSALLACAVGPSAPASPCAEGSGLADERPPPSSLVGEGFEELRALGIEFGVARHPRGHWAIQRLQSNDADTMGQGLRVLSDHPDRLGVGVQLWGRGLRDEHVALIATLRVEELCLVGSSIGPSGVRGLARLPHLRSLSLFLPGSSAATFSGLRDSRVEELVLSARNVDAGLVRDLGRNPRLESLALHGRVDGATLEALGRLPLRELMLDGAGPLRDSDLGRLGRSSSLQVLSLSGPGITDHGLSPLDLPRLRELLLLGTWVSKELAGSLRRRGVRVLADTTRKERAPISLGLPSRVGVAATSGPISPSSIAEADVKFIIWAGQSNCAGVTERGTPENFPFSPYMATFHDRFIYEPTWIAQGFGVPFLPYGPIFGKYRGGMPDHPAYTYASMIAADCGHGSDTYFVHSMTDYFRRDDPEATVVVVKFPWASFSLKWDWTNPDGSESTVTRTMKNKLANAAALAFTSGCGSLEFVNMAWSQGANDAVQQESALDYEAQLEFFVQDHVRHFLGQPDLPVTVVQSHRWLPVSVFPWLQEVRRGQRAWARRADRARVFDPGPTLFFETHDGLHFRRLGYLYQADALSSSFQALLEQDHLRLR